jgi:hypothetical protein
MTRAPRHAVLIIVLSALSVPSLAAARPKHHRKPPTVQCTRGDCVTHFLVEITGSQQTNWRFPFQRVGAADCYHVPYASGDGAQRIQFAGSGVVEATRFGRGAVSFEYLRQGKVRSGIGAGTAHIARFGSYVRTVDPGPCGAGKDVGTYQNFHGCGQARQNWTYDLDPSPRNRVALSAGLSLGTLVTDFDGCPVLWSGLPGGAPADDVYSGVTGRLSAADLFNKSIGTITVVGRGAFAEKPAYSRLGVTGQTQVQWTVTFTRISHNSFPVPSAPLS